jgi:hypothetical protein
MKTSGGFHAFDQAREGLGEGNGAPTGTVLWLREEM